MISANARWAASSVLVLSSLAAACGGSNSTTGTGGTGGTANGGTGGETTASGGTGGATTASGGSGGTGGAAPLVQDILTTDLALDLGKLTGTAKIVVWPAKDATDVALEVKGLTLSDVKLAGAAADYKIDAGVAKVTVPDASKPVTLDIAYSFKAQPASGFNGWMPDSGVTFLWPYFCSNLFPCTSNPDDGATFTMAVTGFDPSLTAVYPKTTTSDSPSYMPAVAVGKFIHQEIGKTTAGTSVQEWYFAGQEADAQMGTAHLVSVIDFYEKTYGAYSFGKEMGSVSANWGPGAFGGMEHHPFVHVAKEDFGSEEVHAHEAAHGWFGDGVRIACWEDFVLSEGTVTYLAAHALESVGAPSVWADYVTTLDAICTGMDTNTIALPSTCDKIDLLNDPLWSNVPYMKGACFYEDVADLIGADKLDQVLADVYKAHVGGTAKMQDMLAAIEAKATPDEKTKIQTYEKEWLSTKACPADYANRCGMHQKP